ncbi:hypothetical protein NUH16_003384 [Penicillium rubens]|nr:hypothetical protein NUH16_003384 [Penicillium rubens]
MTTSGTLVSGASATSFTRVPRKYYVKDKVLRQQLLGDQIVTFAGGVDSPQPEEQMNGMKARIMVGGATHADAKMLGYIDRGEYYTALLEIKTDIGVFAYLKNGEVKSRMQGIIYHIRQQLALTDTALAAKYPDEDIDLVAAWDEYLIDLLTYIQPQSKSFI